MFLKETLFILHIYKVFAIEVNRQILGYSFWLYEESPVTNSSVNMISTLRVPSGSISVRVASQRRAYQQSQRLLFVPVPIEISFLSSNHAVCFIIICKNGM